MSRADLRFLLRRLGQGMVTVVLIILVNFIILHAAPGDVVDVLAGESGSADPEVMARMRAHLGLDQPLPVQFLAYMLRMASFDLGTSLLNGEQVLTLLLGRLPATLLLMVASLALAFIIGVALGVFSAKRAGGLLDAVVSVLALAAYAMPLFWLGLMLIVLFTLKLGLLPSGGIATIAADFGPLEAAWDVAVHMVMPVLTLALFYTATYARLMRASMLEVARANFVRTARAKGLSERLVTWKHIVRNALLPVVTMLGLHVGAILGGAVVVEVVFSWPGLGSLAFEAVFRRDNTVLLGLLFFCSLLVVVVNVLVDLAYRWLDPRVELGGGT